MVDFPASHVTFRRLYAREIGAFQTPALWMNIQNHMDEVSPPERREPLALYNIFTHRKP